MKKFTSIALSLLLVGILSACGGGDQAQEPAPAADNNQAEQPAAEQPAAEQPAEGGTVDAAAAEEKFSQSCASCHGADLSGGAGPNLQQVGAKYSQEQIAGIIENGQGAMPPGMLKGEDAQLVAGWLAEKK